MDTLRTHGAGLVVTGEPGLGRTSLLRWAARSFTAGPVLHLRPGPEIRPRGGPSALDLLGHWRAAAGDGPLLVCVDDADQWDAAARAALGAAAERLPAAGRIGLLVSVAGHRAVDPALAHLPVVRLDPLAPPEAEALLDEATDGCADPAVRAELLAEAEGNPALLLALLRRLTPAELRGHRPLPRPLADAGTLAGVAGRALAETDPAARDLLLTVAAAVRAADGQDTDAALVREAVRRLRPGRATPWPDRLPAPLAQVEGRLRFHSPLVRRAVLATADPDHRRAAHRALAETLDATAADRHRRAAPGGLPGALDGTAGHHLPVLLHRSWSLPAPGLTPTDPSIAVDGPPTGPTTGTASGGPSTDPTGPAAPATLADRLAARAADPASDASHRLRATAFVRAAELTGEGPGRAERYTAAAEQELLAGRPDRARPLLAAARACAAPPAVRGRTELASGLTELRDGPVGDAHQTLLLAASLLAGPAPAQAATAALAAADAAWAAGDLEACLATLGTDRRGDAVSEHRVGMRALLQGRLDQAVVPLGHVVERAGTDDRPETLLRSAAAALLLGEVDAARRAGARALAAARHHGSAALVPQVLEYLAYAELRAGRHAQARAHAEEGLRTAVRAGQRNTAALHQAILALAASIEEAPDVVARHVTAALATARRHGLAQAATLAEWALARADLGRGRPLDAADRLGLLVLPGPRRGHFAVWRLAVPCFVEAAVPAGRYEDARTVLADFADWAAFGADPQAAAQLARCRALLAPAEHADDLYRHALALHDETGGGEFEGARTALLYGKWLRRRRRPKEARDRLGGALAGFERCGAGVWAEQARAELRAIGAAPTGRDTGAGALTRLTPQQQRIARYVAEGATNREVALTLAVSTRTVDYHLRKVFATLGVRSRVELARMVEQALRTTAQP
ncbi:helix-turn-helix transcriptional regulator [Streptomyces fumanus]|uniref:Helix-turn-helix transcriptional regulator n=2 Tax=Streptomyces fumanus TaxID=67302 RepID=A0A919ADR5_9ACTN|nr:helix-turn-helix transcriptional regulator [Streptomyces fumanus]